MGLMSRKTAALQTMFKYGCHELWLYFANEFSGLPVLERTCMEVL